MPEDVFLSPDDLRARIGRPDAPLIIDIRIAEDIAARPGFIPTARRVPYNDFDAVLQAVDDRRSVIVCHGGLKLSQGIAARLRFQGHEARCLQGGHVAWEEAGHPTIPTAMIDPPDAPLVMARDASTHEWWRLWALIRFVTGHRDVLLVERDQIDDVADRFGAMSVEVSERDAISTAIPDQYISESLEELIIGTRQISRTDGEWINHMISLFDALHVTGGNRE